MCICKLRKVYIHTQMCIYLYTNIYIYTFRLCDCVDKDYIT